MSVTKIDDRALHFGSNEADRAADSPVSRPQHETHADTAQPVIAALISQATSHHRAGRLAQAEQLYAEILAVEPNHADALHLSGTIAYQRGDYARAADMIGNALALQPSAAMHGNLGLVAHALGNPDGAIACFREALSLDPGDTSAYNNLGIILKSLGKLAAAAESFLHALASDPMNSAAYCNLGATIHDQGHLQQAVECYEQALSLDPHYAMAYNNLGNACREMGRHNDAVAHFEKSLELDPRYAMAHNNLANVLKDLGAPEAAIEKYRQALALDPGLPDIHSNLLLTLHTVAGCDPAKIFQEHRRFAQQFEQPLKPFWPTHRNQPDKEKRVKVGYVSGDFRDHPVVNFLEPILAGHNASHVELFGYYNHFQNDRATARIAALFHHWLPCKAMSDSALANRIMQDGTDILIDLSGHTAHNRLLVFARKPAPVQLTWLGYQSTTGLDAIDYRLSDASLDPVGETEQFHSEKLLRLQVCAPFRPDENSPPVNELPALTSGHFTLACLNQLTKISQEAIALWARILVAIPHARLLLGNANDIQTRQRIEADFARHGIEAHRLLIQPRLSLAEYLALHHMIDLGLDSFPYNGGTTTCHAVAMGVPVITLAGATPVSRAGKSIMSGIDLDEFVTYTPDDYLRRAVEWASDLPRLNALRQDLRRRVTPKSTSDETNLAVGFETVLREVWRAWCDTASNPSTAARIDLRE